MTSNKTKFILVHRIKTINNRNRIFQNKTFRVLIRIENIKRIEEVERDIEYVPHVFTCISFNNDINDMLIKESIEEIYEKLKYTDDVVLEKTEDL